MLMVHNKMLMNYKNWRKIYIYIFFFKKKRERENVKGRKADKTFAYRSKAYIQLHDGYGIIACHVYIYYTMLHK